MNPFPFDGFPCYLSCISFIGIGILDIFWIVLQGNTLESEVMFPFIIS